jgi:hypothetical protein
MGNPRTQKPPQGASTRTAAASSELPAAQDVDVLRAHRLLVQQLVAGLLGKGLKVANRSAVGGDHFQGLATVHLGKRFLGLQDRQGAVQTAGVNFFVDVHGSFLAFGRF